ncbi:MAG: DUF4249 family protein, partial [Gemmatimonadetes bacterium]|nr:DUF4249 family protein [Gemmatimonadota bacterium]
ALLLVSCGDPSVKITSNTYEPRIVVEGLLIPGHPVTGIRVTRNFTADLDLNLTPIVIGDAEVNIVDDVSGTSFPLTFHTGQDLSTNYYEHIGEDLTIEPGRTYTLEVSAQIDGRQLFTRATTTVPAAGFRIASISHDLLSYRPRGEDGEFVDVKVQIERSPGTTFYLLTAVAMDASVESFIYDNAFTDEKPDDLSDGDIVDFSYNYEWIQNTPPTTGTSTMDVFWWDLWFYGEHRVVIYAADKNYARFVQTFDDVQEEDGNFHEPVFALEGDGIGYFGSAIADTVSLTITR